MMGSVTRVMAACFALAAFAVAIIAGLSAGNAPASVLSRAIIAMLLCYPVGFVAGLVCERVVSWHIAAQDARAAEASAGAAAGAVAGAPMAVDVVEDEEVLTV
jgi:hypothetical protein